MYLCFHQYDIPLWYCMAYIWFIMCCEYLWLDYISIYTPIDGGCYAAEGRYEAWRVYKINHGLCCQENWETDGKMLDLANLQPSSLYVLGSISSVHQLPSRQGALSVYYILWVRNCCVFFSSVFLWICCSVRFPGNLQHFGVGLGCIYTMHLGVYLGLRSKKAETSGEAEAEKQRSRKARSREAEKQRKHKSKCREKQKSRKTKSREAEKQRSRETHIQKNVQHGTT